MGFFDKLKQGLHKTRETLTGKVNEVFKAFKKLDDDFYDELEEALILADLGMDTALDIVDRLRKRVKEKHIHEVEPARDELTAIISEILTDNAPPKEQKKPAVYMIIGVNGVGKTTSIGKLAAQMKAEGKSVILAAADTFRAAAIDQLAVWADRAGVPLVKHQEGSDPAAVVFDAISAAKARGADVVLCDTAGRLHNKKNLMEELKKIVRVIGRELPDSDPEFWLVLDASTGQNAVSQAELFSECANITGIILTKLDGTAKGGVVLSIRQKLGIPIRYVGVGEEIDDLQPFDPESFARAVFATDDKEEETEE
ncbi:MAG: signal recognition particle-docking protein FtsY [Clostridia bacterium]|nr:signal recognition particle-docking protein FtsY [Clostridia bacterium]